MILEGEYLKYGFCIALILKDLKYITHAKEYKKLTANEQRSLVASRLSEDIRDSSFIIFLIECVEKYEK